MQLFGSLQFFSQYNLGKTGDFFIFTQDTGYFFPTIFEEGKTAGQRQNFVFYCNNSNILTNIFVLQEQVAWMSCVR